MIMINQTEKGWELHITNEVLKFKTLKDAKEVLDDMLYLKTQHTAS